MFGRPAEGKLASAVMLARCCADPPPPSVLAWGNSDCSNHGVVGGSSSYNSSFANTAPGRNEGSCLTSSGGIWKGRAEIATPSLAAFSLGEDGAMASGNSVVAWGGPTDPDITVLSGSKRSAPTSESGVEKANRSLRRSISPEELM